MCNHASRLAPSSSAKIHALIHGVQTFPLRRAAFILELLHSYVSQQKSEDSTAPTMSALDASSAVCTVCGEVATTFCAGCASDKTIEDFAPTPTHYCGKGCQTAHWASHKKSCQAVQAKVKLFRAGLLLQQMFLAGRAEAHDLSIARLERAQNGGIHIFDQPSQVGIRPLSSTLTNDENTKNAVLSYGAGDDVYSGLMFELCKRALKGQSISANG